MIKNIKEFFVFIKGDEIRFVTAFIMVILNSISGVVTPFVVAYAIDNFILTKDIRGLGTILLYLAGLYVFTLVVGYAQGILMGTVAQNTLYRLRNALFSKLQSLPIAFFNSHKAGDLMSRVNNDADKLNQLLTETVSRFIGTFTVIFGIGGFILYLNLKLGLLLLSPIIVLVILTKVLSPWIKHENKMNLSTVGDFSASLQENLTNFRVIVAFSKQNYFKDHLHNINKKLLDTAYKSDVANRVFEPIYDFAGSAALIAVIWYGLYLVGTGSATIGIVVAFVTYTQRFYDPLRMLATLFGSIQTSMAAWARISVILNTENTLTQVENNVHSEAVLEVRDLSFGYTDGQNVIENANLFFQKGKTYALVGPTGGGKSTLVSLMSRLYDPQKGAIYIDGKDIRTYSNEDRASIVSVIIQEPIIFSGSVLDNIRYGNTKLAGLSDEELKNLLDKKGFGEVLEKLSTSKNLSLGQKQLISFMRVVLREPKVLILDEATANIDTVTESVLNKTLASLPPATTKIIIAHRLNTIKEADEIYFVNGHHVTNAGSFAQAISLIENATRNS